MLDIITVRNVNRDRSATSFGGSFDLWKSEGLTNYSDTGSPAAAPAVPSVNVPYTKHGSLSVTIPAPVHGGGGSSRRAGGSLSPALRTRSESYDPFMDVTSVSKPNTPMQLGTGCK